MQERFNNWEELCKAVDDESTIWGQLQADGQEILVYENQSMHLLLSTEPVKDPDWIEVEL